MEGGETARIYIFLLTEYGDVDLVTVTSHVITRAVTMSATRLTPTPQTPFFSNLPFFALRKNVGGRLESAEWHS